KRHYSQNEESLHVEDEKDIKKETLFTEKNQDSSKETSSKAYDKRLSRRRRPSNKTSVIEKILASYDSEGVILEKRKGVSNRILRNEGYEGYENSKYYSKLQSMKRDSLSRQKKLNDCKSNESSASKNLVDKPVPFFGDSKLENQSPERTLIEKFHEERDYPRSKRRRFTQGYLFREGKTFQQFYKENYENVNWNLLEGDFFSWLKGLWLHRFYKQFEGMHWREIIELSYEDLEKLGVRRHAPRKILLRAFDNVKRALKENESNEKG
ncbi:13252_t:CDS:2, partial [Acaulospora morrowiae]